MQRSRRRRLGAHARSAKLRSVRQRRSIRAAEFGTLAHAFTTERFGR
jgi:hypothetical protein